MMFLVAALFVLFSFLSCNVSANGTSIDGDLVDIPLNQKELTAIVLEQRRMLLDLAKKYESNKISIADLKDQFDIRSNLNNMQQKDIHVDALKGRIEMMSGRIIQQNSLIRKLKDKVKTLRNAKNDAAKKKSLDHVWKTKETLKDIVMEDKDKAAVENEFFGITEVDNTVKNVSAMESASDNAVSKRTIKTDNSHRRFVLNREGPVAFHATNDNAEIPHLTVKQVVPFNTVLLNIGGAFHTSGSIFIAEQPGIYIFSASILSYVNPHQEITATIVKNGDSLARIYCHGDIRGNDQGSATVIVQLNAGDEVWVRIDYISETSLYGDKYTPFAGALLWNI